MISHLVLLIALLAAGATGVVVGLAALRHLPPALSEGTLQRMGGSPVIAAGKWQPAALALVWAAIMIWARLFTAAMLPLAILAGRLLMARAARARTARQFEEQFEQAAVTMANSLRAGQSLAQAMATVVREYGSPLGTEFHRALLEYQAGLPLIDAIKGIRQRIPCPEAAFFVKALGIHGLTGGNIAGVLANVSRIIRQRRLLRGEVVAKSGEARLTALVLAALPGMLTGYLCLVDRGMLSPLLTTPLGRAGLIYAVISWVVGIIVINRIASSVGGA